MHESNLDHKPFPIEIGHLMPLMHLSKTYFLLKTLGVLPTHEIFCQAPSAFYLGKSNVSKLLAIIHQLTAITFDKELLKKAACKVLVWKLITIAFHKELFKKNCL